MKTVYRLFCGALLAVLVIFAMQCGGGAATTAEDVETQADTETTTFTVGGTIAGLSGTAVLQNNSADALAVSADGSFTFSTAVADGASYAVTVLTQPSGKTCSIANSAGIMSSANVTNVTIVCSTDAYTVGGTLSGLSGTVVLRNNSGDDLTLTANGAFTFTTAVADGASYAVTVTTQPSGASCSVASGTGTISGANVTSVTITCAENTFTIGGTIASLSGTIVLQNNAGNNLSQATNGAFTFATALSDAASYAVTILTQPSGQFCSVTSGSGTVSGANVTNVAVSCSNTQRIWVTNNTTNGNIGNVSGADTKCADTSDTNHPGSGTYKALIISLGGRTACTSANCVTSGASENSDDWVLAGDTMYERNSDRAIIGTTTSAGIFTFPLSAAWDEDSNTVWTGIFTDWRSTGNVCSSVWDSASGGAFGAVGSSNSTSSTAINTGDNSACNNANKIVCVEQ